MHILFIIFDKKPEILSSLMCTNRDRIRQIGLFIAKNIMIQ